MARWYSENPEYSKISLEEKLLRDKLIEIMNKWTRERWKDILVLAQIPESQQMIMKM